MHKLAKKSGEGRLTYLGEFRANWRILVAAATGMGFGFTLYLYIGSLFAPHLLAAFGWSKAQYALISSTYLVAMVTLPVVGRLTDRFGPRPIAAVGIVAYPLLLVAFSATNGSFALFLFLNLLLVMIAGSTTTSALYSRFIAQGFDRSRGFAMSLMASAAPAAVAIATTPLSRLIDAYGWRAGYLALAALVAVAGLIAFLLMPRIEVKPLATTDAAPEAPRDYPAILRNPRFRIILAAMFLYNLQAIAFPTQLKLILVERHAGSDLAALLISIFTGSMVAGRLSCGLMLDRLPPQIIGALALGMPMLGMAALASGFTVPTMLAGAMLIIGLSIGAELAVASYLVMRWFRVEVYSSVYGLLQAGKALASVGGTLLLSLTLKLTGTFDLFLILCGTASAASGAIVLLLGRYAKAN
jgi:MFS family permease